MALITIGMPVFNDIDFIEISLRSILSQTIQDFVLIISDDGSTDGSEGICRQYADRDKRITYIRQPKNLGISKNMEFLLSQAHSHYFMWAADDDLWHPTFIEKHINILESYPEAVSAFCTFSIIDENGNITTKDMVFNYQNNDKIKRVINFIKNANDSFGYGVFRTERIRGVEFPIWWWPNRISAYNNIYPSLCFYLASGDYAQVSGESLFFKRVKSFKKTNHFIPYFNQAIKESLAYSIRKFNLVLFTTGLIAKASSVSVSIITFPPLFFHWFIVPTYEQILLAGKSFLKNKLKISK
jgi:glycosyltransferase involved in cell wall biosynthesis